MGDDESPDFPQKSAYSAQFDTLQIQGQHNSPAKPELLQHSNDPDSRVMTWSRLQKNTKLKLGLGT